MTEKYNIIIIGGGPGGYTAAIRATQLGLKTALVEEREFGGTCLNRGCIPTKALLHTAEMYHSAQHDFEVAGLKANSVSFDPAQIYANKDSIVEQLRNGVGQLLRANKVDCHAGHGRIIGSGLVELDADGEKTVLETENILIASGSIPALPPIPGKDSPGVITSDELLNATDILRDNQLPKKLIVIGGGVIGCEFAGLFAAFGTEVVVIEALDRLLPGMDKDISQNLASIMKKRGIEIHLSAMVQAIESQADGLICKFSGKNGEAEANADFILIATGRKANTAGLLADDVKLDMERGIIIVDEQFRTSLSGVYAIGDVIGGQQLAHKAEAEGLAAVAYIAGQIPDTRLDLIPGCIYTDPEISSVGLTEAQAAEQGIEVKTGKFLMSGNGKTIIARGERGFIKLVFEAESERVLGAHLNCCRATDMISELTVAIANGLTIKDLAAIIRPHPTFNEGITEAVESVHNMSIHSAPKRR